MKEEKYGTYYETNNKIDPLISAKQAAFLLGYKVSYIYNLVYKGKLKAYKNGNTKGGSLRFRMSDIDKFQGSPRNGN